MTKKALLVSAFICAVLVIIFWFLLTSAYRHAYKKELDFLKLIDPKSELRIVEFKLGGSKFVSLVDANDIDLINKSFKNAFIKDRIGGFNSQSLLVVLNNGEHINFHFLIFDIKRPTICLISPDFEMYPYEITFPDEVWAKIAAFLNGV